MSDRFGLAIDQTTNDLFVNPTTGDMGVVTDAAAIAQHVRQRLKTFLGEWFLDTEAGVPWLDELFGRPYDPALAESIVKEEVLNTDGVKEILSFSVGFDRTKRNLIIREIEVLTVYDEKVIV